MDMAVRNGAPCIGLNDSGGARIQEGIDALAGYGEIFERNILGSGVVPQISGIFGPCAGGAVYSPALTDFIVMVKNTSYMFLTGPGVVKSVLGEDVSQEELGGASVHASKSGVAHFAAENEEDGIRIIKELLSYSPQNNMEDAPVVPTRDPVSRVDDALNEIIPDNPNQPYDMYAVIRSIVDDGKFFEIHGNFAKNVIVGFAYERRSVGIVANQPRYWRACWTSASRKAALRALLRCLQHSARDPGRRTRLLRHPAGIRRRDHERREAALCLRRGNGSKGDRYPAQSYGGSHIVMSCKQLRGDLNYAPSAEIA